MSDWSQVPVFGNASEAPAIVRPSAYGLATNADGHVAVVLTKLGFFLPGGGMEPDETPPETVVREFWEECGLEVTIGSWIVRAIDFVYSSNDRTFFEKRSTFVDAHCTERRGVAQEPDHELRWLAAHDAAIQLQHPSDRWAVAQWLARNSRAATRS